MSRYPKTYPTLRSGDLAFYDSFAGLIPCKVLRIIGRTSETATSEAETATSEADVTVRLTATRGAYRKGETLSGWSLHIVPRAAVFTSRGQHRIGPYRVQADA
jgi:hypothetical protein